MLIKEFLNQRAGIKGRHRQATRGDGRFSVAYHARFVACLAVLNIATLDLQVYKRCHPQARQPYYTGHLYNKKHNNKKRRVMFSRI